MALRIKTIAAAAGSDPLDYVMSDATVDRYGDVIEPAGWQLANFRKNPIALFGHDGAFPIGTWQSVRVEDGKLRGRLDLMDPVSDRLRELHTAVNAGVLRAVSVGFRPLAVEPLDSKGGGVRFKQSELVECSLVSVPANPNSLQVARSLHLSDETLGLIFGVSAVPDPVSLPGVPAARPKIHRPAMTLTLSQRIEQAQTSLVTMKDQVHAIIGEQDDDPVMPDDTQALVGELNAKITAVAKSLETMRAAEAAMGAKSDPIVVPDSRVTIIQPHYAFAAPKKEVKPIDYIYRAVAAAVVSHQIHRPISDVIRSAYGDDERTHRTAELLVMRAATVPATTTLVGWAAELVQTGILDFVESLYPMAVYPRLRNLGGRYTFGRNGIVSLPSRSATPTIAGSFVAEGAPIPVRQGAFTAVTLTPKKMAVITTMTRQIAEHSTPAIEQILRDAMGEDTAVALDTVLLDASAATATRPAGLRFGVTPISATAGGGFTALVGDLKGLVGVLSAANALRGPAWIMNPADLVGVSLTQNAGGDFPFRAEAGTGSLLGYPVLSSTTQPKGTVILMDAVDFFSATGDDARFDVSDQATLHMEDTAPLPIASVGTPNVVAAPVRSLWQTDSLGIRMIMDVNWAMRRTGVVTYVSGITW